MVQTPAYGMLVMDGGDEQGSAACAFAGRIGPSSARLALDGADSRDALRTAGVVTAQEFTLERGIEQAAAEGLFWVIAPRRLSDPLSMLVDAAVGAAAQMDAAHPGFAVAFLDEDFRSASRICAVADVRDPVTSGLSVWAAVGLAVRLEADLDVLVLGTSEHAPAPADPQAAMELFRISAAGQEMAIAALQRAERNGLRMQWVPLGSPPDPAAAVLRAAVERGCDILVEDMPSLNVGPKLARRSRVRDALAGSGSGEIAYRMLRDAPFGVVIVLDAVRMGVLPDGLLRRGAAAMLSLGMVGVSTAAVATAGVPTANAMPELAAEAVEEEKEGDQEPSPGTADDLAALQQELGAAAAARDATAEQMAALQAQHAQTVADLAAAQEALAPLEAEAAQLQEAADEASAASTRMGLSTMGPLNLLPFTPSQQEADAAHQQAERADAALRTVQAQVDALHERTDQLQAQQSQIEEQALGVQETLTVQQAAVDTLSQQTADLAWALNPVVVPVAGSDWQLTARFGDTGRYWSGGVHKGLDFAGPVGTPILAAKSGTVIEAGWGGAYGNTVVIVHADGTQTRYAHLQNLHVGTGQAVEVGAQIGTLGNTGNSTGPHLHFEVIDAAGNFIDPAAWLGIG